MPRHVLAALLLLSAPTFGIAQTGDPKPPAAQQDPEAAYKDLAKALNKAIADWRAEAMKKVKEAQDSGQPLPAIAMQPPTGEFIGRAQSLSLQYAGTDDAVRFLVFICKNASTEQNAVRKAIATLASDHAMSPAIGAALPFLEGPAMRMRAKDQVLALLDDVAGKHKDADCQAQALLVRGSIRLQTAQSDDERKAAAEDLRKVATVAKDDDLKKQAKDALFEIENLQVGCTAPDIAAKDVDGVDFKLSDYRGKVVLLDFWGFW